MLNWVHFHEANNHHCQTFPYTHLKKSRFSISLPFNATVNYTLYLSPNLESWYPQCNIRAKNQTSTQKRDLTRAKYLLCVGIGRPVIKFSSAPSGRSSNFGRPRVLARPDASGQTQLYKSVINGGERSNVAVDSRAFWGKLIRGNLGLEVGIHRTFWMWLNDGIQIWIDGWSNFRDLGWVIEFHEINERYLCFRDFRGLNMFFKFMFFKPFLEV